MATSIGKILLNKLNDEDIKQLCEAWDDGLLDDAMLNEVLPVDVKNHPELYVGTRKMLRKRKLR